MVKNTRGNGEVPTSTDIYINTRGKGCKYIFLLFRYIYIVSLPKFREAGRHFAPPILLCPGCFRQWWQKIHTFYIDFFISIVYDTLEKYGVLSQRAENGLA